MNKYLGRKGQGAMEYLMTYGWAILVVMIVGVVLWQLGIFNLGSQGSKTMTGFGAVKPLDWSMTSDSGNDTVILLNGEGSRITLNGVTLTGQGGESCSGNLTSAITIEAGDSAQLSTPWCTGTKGASYKIQISVAYMKNIGGINQTHSSVGTIRSIFE